MVEIATTKQTAIKAYKENKPFIKKYITDELPKVFRITKYTSVVPGFLFINHGINYLGNEPFEPCRDYYIPVTELEEEDLEQVFKNEFKRRGEKGLLMKIKEVKALHEIQKEQFPKAFEN